MTDYSGSDIDVVSPGGGESLRNDGWVHDFCSTNATLVRRGVFVSSQALNHFAAIGLMSQIQKAVKRLKDIHR